MLLSDDMAIYFVGKSIWRYTLLWKYIGVYTGWEYTGIYSDVYMYVYSNWTEYIDVYSISQYTRIWAYTEYMGVYKGVAGYFVAG